MNTQKQLRRIAKLGIGNFETVADVERLQGDLLQRLERSSIDPDRYNGLADCTLSCCGREECMAACCFGNFRRRLRQVPAALRLLENARPPFHEVRIIRGVWSRPFGKLRKSSIAAAKQLNRRVLDALYDNKIVAVGSFKVAPAGLPHGYESWMCEIHQIVAGVQKHDLERIFYTQHDRGELRTKRKQNEIPNMVRVQKVTEFGPAISEVLRQDLRGWRHPWRDEIAPPRPTKAQRREFYRWLLGLTPDARIIRYGCDRYFNKLEKRARPIRPKVKKKRPYPYWLQRHFFGSFEREQRDSQRAKERYLNELRGVYDDGARRQRSGGTVRMDDPEKLRKYYDD
jgi:hypothetical protein